MTRRASGAADRSATRSLQAPAAARRSARPSLALSLRFADASHRSLLTRAKVARWLRAALAAPAELAVVVVDAEEGLALNRDHRGGDHATNVLTFAYERSPAVVADIVLCAPVIEAEAGAAGRSLEAHYAHLVVHGALHAQGFDHERARDAKVMESRESAILVALGYDDPYAIAE